MSAAGEAKTGTGRRRAIAHVADAPAYQDSVSRGEAA
jgi:hypothetical protein